MKTKSERYNEFLNKTFAPELDRLRRVEEVAKEILGKIKTLKSENPNIDNCHLINAVQRILSEKTNLKN